MKLVDMKEKNKERNQAMLKLLELVKKDIEDDLLRGLFITGLDKEGMPFYYLEYEEKDEVEMLGALMCSTNSILKNRGTIKYERED